MWNKARLNLVSDFNSIESNSENQSLAKLYARMIKIPTRAELDAYHLAVASIYELTYLVSWNCTHIASGRVRKIVQDINASLNLPVPIICTPRELMEV